MPLINLSPEDVAGMLDDIVLVDVREPNEFASERIKGAVNLPLSRFHPADLPSGHVVLQCAGGVRSARAVEACEAAGVAVSEHLAGGIRAWMAAGLPVER